MEGWGGDKGHREGYATSSDPHSSHFQRASGFTEEMQYNLKEGREEGRGVGRVAPSSAGTGVSDTVLTEFPKLAKGRERNPALAARFGNAWKSSQICHVIPASREMREHYSVVGKELPKKSMLDGPSAHSSSACSPFLLAL